MSPLSSGQPRPLQAWQAWRKQKLRRTQSRAAGKFAAILVSICSLQLQTSRANGDEGAPRASRWNVPMLFSQFGAHKATPCIGLSVTDTINLHSDSSQH